MDFSNQRLTITKPMIELTDLSGGSGLTQERQSGGNRFEDNVMVFHEKERHVVPSH